MCFVKCKCYRSLYVWETEQQQQQQCNFCLYTKSVHWEEHTLLARLLLSVKSGRSGTHLAPEHRVNFSPPADRRLPGSPANWLTGSYILPPLLLWTHGMDVKPFVEHGLKHDLSWISAMVIFFMAVSILISLSCEVKFFKYRGVFRHHRPTQRPQY